MAHYDDGQAGLREAHYRTATTSSDCANCRFSSNGGTHCRMFDVRVEPTGVCDSYAARVNKAKAGSLTLLRHGKTAYNGDGADDKIRGHKNVPLDATGKKQAQELADASKAFNLDCLHSSDLDRAIDTAKPVAAANNLQIEQSDAYRPWHLGDFQGESSKKVSPELRAYVKDKPDRAVPGGESFNDFKARFIPAFEKLLAEAKTGRNVGLVTHYRNAKMAQAYLDGGGDSLDLDTFLADDLKPAEALRITPSGDGWKAVKVTGGSSVAKRRVVARKEATVAAGIAVRAADTGRVLMLQRSISDLTHPAAGKWEFPGGCLDDGETAQQAAVREWQEETGTTLPTGSWVGGWKNSVYEGFVYVVPREDDVKINVDHDDRLVANPDDPDGDDSEVIAWWPPADAKKMPGLRDGVELADWDLIERSVPNGVFKDGVPASADTSTALGDIGSVPLGPTLNTSHVNAPLPNLSTAYVRARKKKKVRVVAKGATVQIVKTDAAKQIVYGVVLEPHKVDTQGDTVRVPEIEQAAWRYLSKAVRGKATVHTVQHKTPGFFKDKPGIVPVESYIAPVDFQFRPGGATITKGSWVLVAKIEDPGLWRDVMEGRYTGWSVGGSGLRTPLA